MLKLWGYGLSLLQLNAIYSQCGRAVGSVMVDLHQKWQIVTIDDFMVAVSEALDALSRLSESFIC